MPLSDLGLARGGGGATLVADRASFAAGTAAGQTIALLSNPFPGATSYAVVGSAPAQLALSGGAVVAGSAAAASGQRYAVKIRATSADGSREIAETIVFLATGTAAATTLASASLRARLPNGQAAAGVNNVYAWRVRDIANVDVADPWLEVWNGWVNVGVAAPASPEVAGPNAVPYRAAFVTGLSGTAANQAAATVTPLTWNAAYAGAAGSLWKLDGTTPAAADLSAAVAAGTLALADQGRQLTLPPGWRARSDPATGLTLPRRTPYFWQIEDAPAQGQYRVNGGAQPRGDLGDLQRAGTASGQYVYAANWTGASAPAAQMTTPVLIGGTAAAGARTVGIAGDSISMEVRDSAYGSGAITGDADQATAYAPRALNAAGYAFVQTAIAGDKASAAYKSVAAGNGGMAQRLLSLRLADAIVDGMGHNDRNGAPADFLAYYRWWWAQLRSAARAPRIVKFDLLPVTTTSDEYRTTANQTPGTSSRQWDSGGHNDFINRTGPFAGVPFARANGDPDAGWSISGALLSWGTAAGLDVAGAQRWPANGQSNLPLTGGNAPTYDGTHPKGPAHAGIAALLAPALPGLLGF